MAFQILQTLQWSFRYYVSICLFNPYRTCWIKTFIKNYTILIHPYSCNICNICRRVNRTPLFTVCSVFILNPSFQSLLLLPLVPKSDTNSKHPYMCSLCSVYRNQNPTETLRCGKLKLLQKALWCLATKSLRLRWGTEITLKSIVFQHFFCYHRHYAPIAQLVEQSPLKRTVVGSNPTRRTRFSIGIWASGGIGIRASLRNWSRKG